jgi:glycosyltransferase involved in cell wall biosynthesis
LNIAIDAVGIRGHGGAAVLCELLHWFPRVRPAWRWHVFLFERKLREFDDPSLADTVVREDVSCGDSALGRLCWVRSELQKRLHAIRADALFSFANIGSPRPIVPQVVFVHQRNAFCSEGISRHAFLTRLRLRALRCSILSGARASRAIIVQTAAMRDRMQELEPKLSGRIHVVPSGFRTPAMPLLVGPEKIALIDKTGRPRLIYVSHPGEHKNHVSLVQALPAISESFPNVQLLLTLERDVPPNRRYRRCVREIARAANDAGVADRIVWLGRLQPQEVCFALSESDLMVFPSVSESFGLGLAEAMAAGCPIAASDLPYAHEVAGAAALYFRPREPRSIAHTVIAALSDKDGLVRMRHAAKDLAVRFRYRSIAETLASILERVVE